MELDEDLCVCFHVSRRKVLNFLRVQCPHRAGQLANCFGAGTGCGWCRPFLQQLFDEAQTGDADPRRLPTEEDYRTLREGYLRAGRRDPLPCVPPEETPERPTGD